MDTQKEGGRKTVFFFNTVDACVLGVISCARCSRHTGREVGFDLGTVRRCREVDNVDVAGWRCR